MIVSYLDKIILFFRLFFIFGAKDRLNKTVPYRRRWVQLKRLLEYCGSTRISSLPNMFGSARFGSAQLLGCSVGLGSIIGWKQLCVDVRYLKWIKIDWIDKKAPFGDFLKRWIVQSPKILWLWIDTIVDLVVLSIRLFVFIGQQNVSMREREKRSILAYHSGDDWKFAH